MEKELLAFENYVKPYKEQAFEYDLKIAHIYRVTNYCEIIARSLNLNEDEIKLAKLCGLLHDIARFEQFKIYNTFSDSKSIDHGSYGEQLLREGLIKEFNDNRTWDEIIYKAVKHHNKYSLPDDLTDKERLFCQIIRDADKIDILYLVTTKELPTPGIGNTITDSIMKSVLSNQPINIKDAVTKADFNCLRIAFVYDFNFKGSFEILKDKNHINELIDWQIEESDEKTCEKWQIIKEHVNKYINAKII